MVWKSPRFSLGGAGSPIPCGECRVSFCIREGGTDPAAGSLPGNPLKKQGWASVGRDTPLASKCCSLSDWPRVSPELPPAPPRMKKRKLPELYLLPTPHSSTLWAPGRAAPR